mgnify:CR=1 FL=1
MKAKVFKSGNSQAIRIPKEVQTDRQEFIIRKVGEGRIKNIYILKNICLYIYIYIYRG